MTRIRYNDTPDDATLVGGGAIPVMLLLEAANYCLGSGREIMIYKENVENLKTDRAADQ